MWEKHVLILIARVFLRRWTSSRERLQGNTTAVTWTKIFCKAQTGEREVVPGADAERPGGKAGGAGSDLPGAGVQYFFYEPKIDQLPTSDEFQGWGDPSPFERDQGRWVLKGLKRLDQNGMDMDMSGKQKYEQLVEVKLSLEMEISTYRSILEDEEKRIKRWRRKLLTFWRFKWKFTTWGKIKTVLLHQWSTILRIS